MEMRTAFGCLTDLSCLITGCRQSSSVADTLRSLTLAVPAIAAEIAAACVFELAVAFGADADHVGHDSAGDGFLVGVLARYRTRGVGKILDAPHGNHDALRDGLLG